MTGESPVNNPKYIVKWERHSLGHSPYELAISDDHLGFVPHSRSVLTNEFAIPYATIETIRTSDNFLWRGAINVILKTDLVLDLGFELPIGFHLFSRIFEPQLVFRSKRVRLFLGNHRRCFLDNVPGDLLKTD